MSPFASDTEDTRSQPWKEWVEEELEARKEADATEEGRAAQEERVHAYMEGNHDEDAAYESPANKAG
ncbi:hypothetical protein MKZ38_001007 [Zalerion maritima]|uniref:Uncharacterized protein n=1 Tax=Zalerion maritima TaxID=339359 RepID=A0AAD5WS75_9PEZI|nr:hypothetical protein MKZ38_001007 [Zalerion maritima]